MEVCSKCGSENFGVIRDMTSRRVCPCGHTWPCPPKAESSGCLKIEEMFAFVAIDDGVEGIVGINTPSGWAPLVGADMKRVDALRPLAKKIAETSEKEIRILKFSVREDLGAV